jgi:LysR family transcriptional regulator, nitrogen assimilation regulatory protein
MELIQLRYFVQVAALGSFSRAAVRLGVTQPTLSRQIQQLERELASGLFYRHGRGVALTDAGRRLLAAVGPLVEQLDHAAELLRQEAGEVAGEVTIGLPMSLALTVGASVASAFLARHPKARLQVYEGSTGLLLEWLENGRLDVAVLYEARLGPNMLANPLLEEQVYLVTPPSECRGEGEPVRVDELARRRLVLPGPQSGLRRLVERATQAAGVRIRVVMDLHSVTITKQLVERGEACTVLPFGAIHREVADGRIGARRIESPDMVATLVSVTAAGQPVTLAATRVLDLVVAALHRSLEAGTLRGKVLIPERLGRLEAARTDRDARTA